MIDNKLILSPSNQTGLPGVWDVQSQSRVLAGGSGKLFFVSIIPRARNEAPEDNQTYTWLANTDFYIFKTSIEVNLFKFFCLLHPPIVVNEMSFTHFIYNCCLTDMYRKASRKSFSTCIEITDYINSQKMKCTSLGNSYYLCYPIKVTSFSKSRLWMKSSVVAGHSA